MTGLVRSSQFPAGSLLFQSFEVGDWIKAEVVEFNREHGRFTMKYVEEPNT